MHESKMKRWAVFTDWRDDEPLGAMADFEAAFATREEAEEHVKWRSQIQSGLYVVDMAEYLSKSYDCWNADICKAVKEKDILDTLNRETKQAEERGVSVEFIKAINAYRDKLATTLFGDGND